MLWIVEGWDEWPDGGVNRTYVIRAAHRGELREILREKVGVRKDDSIRFELSIREAQQIKPEGPSGILAR